MSQIRLTSSASGVITVTTPTTSANRTLTLPDETGTVITTESTIPPKVPALVVQTTSTTSFSSQTKIPLNSVVTDSESWFDTTNYRYVPQQAGYYFFSAYVGTSNSNTPTYGQINIRKNNTSFCHRYISISNNQYNSLQVTGIVDLNGSTDYVEVFAQFNVTRALRNGTATQLQGFLIRTL